MIDHSPFDFRLDQNSNTKGIATSKSKILVNDVMSQIFKLRDKMQTLAKIVSLCLYNF